MSSQSLVAPIVVGLALFSMFFGSGNLIFPLFLGQLAQESWLYAFFGFAVTAVLVPFLGVVAMLMYDGSQERFFKPFGKQLSWIFSAVLLTVWIPLGSGPRCIALSYATLTTYLDLPYAFAYSVVYTLLVWLIVAKRRLIIDLLGYFLTPIFLGCLSLIAYWGWNGSGAGLEANAQGAMMFWRGMLEGYNTMDLIAAFFFSSTVIHMLRASEKDEKRIWLLFLQSGVVAMGVLAVVYFGLVRLSAVNSDLLLEVPKEQMLAFLAQALMGSLSPIAGIAIFLACLTTSVALVVVYADFLSKTFGGGPIANQISLYGTLAVCGGMSLIGLSGITAVTAPLLQVFYPLLFLMIIVRVGSEAYRTWTLPVEAEA